MSATDPMPTDPINAAYGRDQPPRQGSDATRAAMIRSHELEAAMLAAPHDRAPRETYFDHLRRISATHTGLWRAELPELGHPLYFRAGSSDVANIAQVFRDEEYGFPVRATPLRILDLGAYAGYAAIYLARRFPRAFILCVEPSPDSYRLLTLNTTPYRQIVCVNAAVWHTTTRLAVGARYYGDWGLALSDAAAPALRTIPARSVADLMAMYNWNQVDLVKCDIEGSERMVFSDPNQDWLRGLDVLVAETHDTIAPGASAAVAACFEPRLFEHRRHGENEVYQRRVPFRATPPAPPPIPLISSEPGLAAVLPENIPPQPWCFFAFDGTSFQLHPNAPGQVPARVAFPRVLAGQRRFSASLHHAGSPSPTIVFSMFVERPDGTVVAGAQHALAAGERLSWQVPLPPLEGLHRIVLQTEMSRGAPHNYNAWARWERPTLD